MMTSAFQKTTRQKLEGEGWKFFQWFANTYFYFKDGKVIAITKNRLREPTKAEKELIREGQ